MEGQLELAFSNSEVPYDLEKPRAYIESYHSTIPFDICDALSIYVMELLTCFIMQMCTLSLSKLG